MQNSELGETIREHERVHDLAVRHRAELEQMGDFLITIGSHLKKDPDSLGLEEAKAIVRNKHDEETAILWSQIDISRILEKMYELRKASTREKELARELIENGLEYVVEGLKNRKGPTPDILRK